MRLKGGFTPKEMATAIALEALKDAHNNNDSLTYYMDESPIEHPGKAKALKKALATLHNRLLGKSKLDGQFIGDA